MTGLRVAAAPAPSSEGSAFQCVAPLWSRVAFDARDQQWHACSCGAVPALAWHLCALCAESSCVYRCRIVRNMVAVSRVFFCCVVGRALGQSPWQAGEPMVVTVDYDVPMVAGAGARSQAAELASSASSGFSATALSSARRLRGDAVPPVDADVVVHVPDGGFGSADLKRARTHIRSSPAVLPCRCQIQRRLFVGHALAEMKVQFFVN